MSYMEYADGYSNTYMVEGRLYTPNFYPTCGAKMDAKEEKQ